MLRNLFNAFFIVLAVLTSTTIGHADDITIDSSSSFLYPGYSQKISMDFQNASLVDVLKIFSQQTKINLVSSEELAAKRITVFLDNVPVEQALEQVLRANNLTYELQPDSNIYVVKPITKTNSELVTRVYLLKHASVSSARILKTLKISYTTGTTENEVTESSSSGGGGGSGSGETSTGIKDIIKSVLTAENKEKIVEDARTNSLTITDIASNFINIEAAIAKLDIAVPQVLIEVEMLEVSKETGDQIGIKFGSTPLTFTGAERDHVYPWNQNSLLAKGYTFAEPEYRVGTISAAGMSAILQFLQTQTDTKNLARPRILTLNNQPAQIKISTQEAISANESTISSSSSLSQSSTAAERVETGVSLTVTPQVNFVDNNITMAVVPKVITTTLSLIKGSNGSSILNPEERGSLSILRVANGDTVVLGGLIKTAKSTTITKLPILGDIPFIGSAFRHKSDSSLDRELIIFLTPHILSEGLEKNIALPKQPILQEQREQAPNKQQAIDRALTKRKKL